MLNLVIVDDEYEIINGLSNYFPWNDIGYNITGSYTDASCALEHIVSGNNTDVLLTDIRMPGMTGLELCERVLNYDSGIKCVIISGYKEFEYARQCMELGIKDYIVKPTKFNEIRDVFTRIRDELAISRQEGNEHKTINRIKQYVSNNLSHSSLYETAEYVGLNPYYLSTLFHKETNEKFVEYVLRCKMVEAQRMLTETRLSIQEIGTKLGYMNANSFSRAFRAYFGTNPKSIRDSL